MNSTVDAATHKRLITTGCLMWCASFFGEGYGAQPYSTVGIVVSPVVTIIGIFYWIKYYRINRGYFPEFGSTFYNLYFARTNKLAGMDFIMNHVLEFWTLCILFWMALSSTMFFFYRSDAFESTKTYCQNTPTILMKTGAIRYFSPFVSGSIGTNGDNSEADFSFIISGAKGNFRANSKVTKQHSGWIVKNVELE